MAVTNDLADHIKYLTWLQLTDGGRVSRDQLSAFDQAKYDAVGLRPIMPVPDPMTEEQRDEARRLYIEVCEAMDCE